jgi:nitronate monooxygenase
MNAGAVLDSVRGMLRTRFTEMFGLTYPVMSAPMALHSGGRLAGAVTAAGGLGSFGGVHPAKGPDWIEAEIATIRQATDGPYAVGFITAFLPMFEPLFEASLGGGGEADGPPAVIALSFGDPQPWLDRAKKAGARVMCQVQTYDDAARAVDAGADVLVAQGTEAGGHTGPMSLLPFLAGVAERWPDVPVLAAGGIADGRTLAAALTAGADGAWVGTAFLATPEAVEVHDIHKELIVASDGGDTVLTRAYDIVSGLPWPAGIAERTRRNRFTDEWTGRDVELQGRREEFAPPPGTVPFQAPPDPDSDGVLYGQGAGLVPAVRPAGDVLRTMCDDAETILRTRPPQLLT